jgi:hypothetical protein
LISRRHIRLWLSFGERNVLLYISPSEASAYVLLTNTVWDKDTTANGPAMGGLRQFILKGTHTFLRRGRGSDVPNLPDLINMYAIYSLRIEKLMGLISGFSAYRKVVSK